MDAENKAKRTRKSPSNIIMTCNVCELELEEKKFRLYYYKGERRRRKTCNFCVDNGDVKILKDYKAFVKTADEKIKAWAKDSVREPVDICSNTLSSGEDFPDSTF